jgi:hypothetical protein
MDLGFRIFRAVVSWGAIASVPSKVGLCRLQCLDKREARSDEIVKIGCRFEGLFWKISNSAILLHCSPRMRYRSYWILPSIWHNHSPLLAAGQQLVPLFSLLPPLNNLPMCPLCHLLEPLSFFLCLPLVHDGLNPPFSLGFLLAFHLLLNCFGGFLSLIFHLAFVVGRKSCSWSKGFFGSMPLLSLVDLAYERSYCPG